VYSFGWDYDIIGDLLTFAIRGKTHSKNDYHIQVYGRKERLLTCTVKSLSIISEGTMKNE
jgi:hypothetical protein